MATWAISQQAPTREELISAPSAVIQDDIPQTIRSQDSVSAPDDVIDDAREELARLAKEVTPLWELQNQTPTPDDLLETLGYKSQSELEKRVAASG